MTMTSEQQLEIAWAAGFWTGEGCVYSGKSKLPHLSLTQCGDEGRELCERFVRALGFDARCVYRGQDTVAANPRYVACVPGRAAAEAALELCRPYLSRTKIAQAEAVLAAHAQRKAAYVHHFGGRGCCVHGHPFTPANTLIRKGTNTRLCRTCARARPRRQVAA